MRPLIAMKGNRIMPDNRSIIDQTLDRQKRMFRIAQDPTRYGLSLKLIAMDSGLGYDSVRNYAAGETQMPLSALNALIGVIPEELLSLLVIKDRQIISLPDGIDHDEFERWCLEFLAVKGSAHHPESPAGRELSSCEIVALNKAAAPMAVRA